MFSLDTAIDKEEAKQHSPVVLAFVGDAVYSLYIREKLAMTTDYKTGELQRLTSAKVSAHGQSELLNYVLPLLTEEETDVFKRGRNAKKATKSKNASVAEYNRSTGFEALLGFLYMSGERERIDYLLSEALEAEKGDEK